VHGALVEAGGTARAALVVEPVALPDAELDHRVLRTRAETSVALEAVAAREAAAGFVPRLWLGQAAEHFAEVDDPLLG
jgi:hypothetical protein